MVVGQEQSQVLYSKLVALQELQLVISAENLQVGHQSEPCHVVFLVKTGLKIPAATIYRAFKSHALSVSPTHFNVISHSHAHTSISHALALHWKVTLLFWQLEVLIIIKFLPLLLLNCLVLIN